MLNMKKHTKAKQNPSAKRTAPTPHKRYKCCNATNVQPQRSINTTNAVNAIRVQPQCPINATNTLNATKNDQSKRLINATNVPQGSRPNAHKRYTLRHATPRHATPRHATKNNANTNDN